VWVYQLTVIALFDRCFLQRIDLDLLKDRGVQLLENNGHPWNVMTNQDQVFNNAWYTQIEKTMFNLQIRFI
jgi:hypothetical protein